MIAHRCQDQHPISTKWKKKMSCQLAARFTKDKQWNALSKMNRTSFLLHFWWRTDHQKLVWDFWSFSSSRTPCGDTDIYFMRYILLMSDGYSSHILYYAATAGDTMTCTDCQKYIRINSSIIQAWLKKKSFEYEIYLWQISSHFTCHWVMWQKVNFRPSA